MLRALRRFEYEVLTLSINKEKGDLAQLSITLEGRNPDVLEGYPFRFNINLETNIEPLLKILKETGRISQDVLQRGWLLR